MAFPLEAVPNFSEGRNRGTIDAIGRALAAHARLLDVHADVDHNRSVFTLGGAEEEIVEALAAGVACARDRIDLRTHEGAHPRVGAADVVPLVPLAGGSMVEAESAALAVAEAVGRDLGLPVFLYGEIGRGRRPAFFRRGGLPELRRRMASHELVPEFGSLDADLRSGVVLVGARPPLVAYNVELATDDPGVARDVAAAIRESSGGLPGVQAIGLSLPRSRRIQVSMNVLDLERSPLHEVVRRVEVEARARGVEAAGGELVGLVPQRVLDAAASAGVRLPGVDEAHVLERRLGL